MNSDEGQEGTMGLVHASCLFCPVMRGSRGRWGWFMLRFFWLKSCEGRGRKQMVLLAC